MDEKLSLPEELMIEVVLRLSIKALLRFRSICKVWQSLIENPTFNTRYSSICHASNKNKLLWFHRVPKDKKYVLSLIDCETAEKITDLEFPSFLNEEANDTDKLAAVISILGPVNGIYCLCQRVRDTWSCNLILWNPTTRECKHIFPPVVFPLSFEFFTSKWQYHWCYQMLSPRGIHLGFGYDNKVKDFKVVAMCHWEVCEGYNDDSWHVRVYNLSTDSWSTVHYFKTEVSSFYDGMRSFFYLSSYPDFGQCYLNGVLHWQVPGSYEILAFDICTECFHAIKGPPLPSGYHPCASTWVYKDSLAMAFTDLEDNQYPCGAFVWTMMEYCLEDSWTMLYSYGPISGLTFVGIPNDNQIFFCNPDGQLISFNLEDKETQEFGVYGTCDRDLFLNIHGGEGLVRYEETFVTLKPIYYGQ